MAHKFPRADHLTTEEVDYELTIRDRAADIRSDLDAKQRLLRNLFFVDAKEGREYGSKCTIDQMFEFILGQVEAIEKQLEKGPDDRCISRLKHYALRVERLQAQSPQGEELKNQLEREVNRLLNKFSSKKTSEDKHAKKSEENKGTNAGLKGIEELLNQEKEKSKEAGAESLSLMKQNVVTGQHERLEENVEAKLRSALEEKTAKEKFYLQKIQQLEAKLEKFCQIVERQSVLEHAYPMLSTPEVARTLPVPSNKTDNIHTGQQERISQTEQVTANMVSRSNRNWNNQSQTEQVECRREMEEDPRTGNNNRLYSVWREENDRMGDERRRHEQEFQSWRRSATGYEDEYERNEMIGRGREGVTNFPGYGGPRQLDTNHRNEFSRINENQQPYIGRLSAIQQPNDDESIPDDFRREHRANRQPEARSQNRYARSEDLDNGSRGDHSGNRSYQRNIEAEIINADRRMEKWHLTFSGDGRQRSLEDFLHKVRRLARMDRISDGILLQRIHTILRGEAYDWYLCYADEFLDWADFEERIRYMYGNPNKDQGNRQKIYERKQQRNETFLTFKMEVERLNKLLSTPLDQTRLFEIIWDNMRPHYRSRLACRTVRDLRMLEYYAYRIDANDPTFRGHREGPNRPTGNVHNIEAENESSDSHSIYSDSEEVNALDRRFNRDRRSKDDRRQTERKVSETPTQPQTVQQPAQQTLRETSQMLCWNCGKTGHMWRYCREEKRIFCYVCGTPGKTSVNCPNHPRSSQQVMSGN
ncbi:trichohyalin-like [Aedes albopictus]|uniref:CCHC-type domain-containing protein n=1 Tax=Aedes albopictus TaxID=7160 RepID=A0ABM1YGV2_AEDAL